MKAEPAVQLPAQMIPPNIAVFQLTGAAVQSEGAALSLGNCTARITNALLAASTSIISLFSIYC